MLSLFRLDAKLADELKLAFNLVKIDSVTIMSTEKPMPQRSSQDNESSENSSREKKSVFILSDEQQEPICATAENLPVHVGTYMYFDDSRWWDKAPEYVDVAPTVRVVSISCPITDVPRFENEKRRIRIISTDTDISVHLSARASLNFKNMHPTEGRPTECLEEHPNSTWTL